MSQQPTQAFAQHSCPRCNAPIQVGQATCAVCRLPLDPASVQAFYMQREQERIQAIYHPPQYDVQQQGRKPTMAILAVVLGVLVVSFVALFLIVVIASR